MNSGHTPCRSSEKTSGTRSGRSRNETISRVIVRWPPTAATSRLLLARLRHNRLYPLIPRERRLRRVSKDEAETRHLGLMVPRAMRSIVRRRRASARRLTMRVWSCDAVRLGHPESRSNGFGPRDRSGATGDAGGHVTADPAALIRPAPYGLSRLASAVTN